MKLINWLVETWRMPWFYTMLGIESPELSDFLEATIYFNIQPSEISEAKLTAVFDGVKIWLGNYPHASYSLWDDKRSGRLLPNKRTNYRFNNYINAIILKDLGVLNEKISNTTKDN